METVKGKKFLVTGGTGFLGQNFVKYVIDNGGEADFLYYSCRSFARRR
jgi:dTDP-D-glucose 4,6-dehydratase